MTRQQGPRLGALERRMKAAELYIQGWTQHAMAAHFGVTQATISEDLHYVRRQWRASAVRNFDEARDLELKKIDRVEREAWDAWDRSQKPVQSAVVTDDAGRQRSTKSLRNQHGDAKYLDVVLKCVQQRCALLGIEANAEEAVADVSGEYKFNRDRILDVVAQLRQRAGAAALGGPTLPLQPGDVRPADERG
jgi:predicted transcriptional regulator